MMPMPASKASDDQKSHVAPHFSYLDQTNALVLISRFPYFGYLHISGIPAFPEIKKYQIFKYIEIQK